MKTIKADVVQQKIASNEDVILINALGADSFRAKHISGSINIPAQARWQRLPSTYCHIR